MRDYKAAAAKMRQTKIARFGSEEAYRKYMQEIGRRGGQKTWDSGKLIKHGFAGDSERASVLAKKSHERPLDS